MDEKNKPTYNINGRVIDTDSRRGIAGLRVEAWDKDLIHNDLVGSAETDAEGRFQIGFTRSYFGEALEGGPDLFFKVFSGDEQVASTEESVQWDADGAVKVEIPMPQPGGGEQPATLGGGEGLAPLNLNKLSAREVGTATRNFVKATQLGRVKEMAAALAPDFSFIDERGGMVMAAACMSTLEDKVSNPPPEFENVARLKVNSFNMAEVTTRTFGGTVVETMVYTDNVTVRESTSRKVTTFNRSFRWTNVWVEHEGGYKLALTQLTPIQA